MRTTPEASWPGARRLVALGSCVIILAACSQPAAVEPPTRTAALATAVAPAAVVAKTEQPPTAAPKVADQKPATPVVDPKPAASPRESLLAAFRGWGATKSFRARISTTGLPGGATSEMKIDVVMPDRLHATNDRMEMVKVGGDLFFKLPTGWQKVAQGLDIDFANPKQLESDIGATTEARLLGPDLYDGTPCLVYEYATTFRGGGDVGGPAAAKDAPKTEAKPQTHTAKVWIAIADNLPRKLESSDPNNGVKSTIVYYDFNAPITINAPS